MKKRTGVLFGLLALAGIALLAVALAAPHLLLSLRDRATRLARPAVTDMPGKPVAGPQTPLAAKLAAKGLQAGQPVFIRIIKESSELELWVDNGRTWTLLHIYPVCRWSGTLGPKIREGDGQAPEGFYMVTRGALNPKSSYHLSFNLGFPNAFDAGQGRTGSFLMVHGDCLSIGCYAMTDAGIEDIYAMVGAALNAGQKGVPVHVFPFRMDEANMTRHAASPWKSFWTNLKEGWDAFEASGRPPLARACGGRYRFEGAATGSDCADIRGM
jgi:murein L,D-transpeptidase YafK